MSLGHTLMDTGYFYCPYIPITSTPVIFPAGFPTTPIGDENLPEDISAVKPKRVYRSIDDPWEIDDAVF